MTRRILASVPLALTIALVGVPFTHAQQTCTTEPQAIVNAFIQTESRLSEALTQHTFKRDVMLQTIGSKGQVAGEYVRNVYQLHRRVESNPTGEKGARKE